MFVPSDDQSFSSKAITLPFRKKRAQLESKKSKAKKSGTEQESDDEDEGEGEGEGFENLDPDEVSRNTLEFADDLLTCATG